MDTSALTLTTDAPVLVIDDDPDFGALVERWLVAAGAAVVRRETGHDARVAVDEHDPAVVILDLGLPDVDGLAVLAQLLEDDPARPVVILTADHDVATAVRAMRQGAWDYVAKPVDRARLLTTIKNAAETRALKTRLAHLERDDEGLTAHGILGRAPAMQALFRDLDRVIDTDVTVVVRGESGAGKELVARALHDGGRRRRGTFVAVNCAAIPEALLEAELFGHEKGAFTGATVARDGLLALADGGTLFLDEIAELALPLQAKLLRVLQERTYARVGSTRTQRSDFRLVAASHQDLAEHVRRGLFREDLFYRLAVFELVVPPLRERTDDIPLLATAILDRLAAHLARRPRLDEEAMLALVAYPWPGNVRELDNVLQHALLVCDGVTITVPDLPARLRPSSTSGSAQDAPTPMAGARATSGPRLPVLTLDELERLAIIEALARHPERIGDAIAELAIPRATFYRKLKRFGLQGAQP